MVYPTRRVQAIVHRVGGTVDYLALRRADKKVWQPVVGRLEPNEKFDAEGIGRVLMKRTGIDIAMCYPPRLVNDFEFQEKDKEKRQWIPSFIAIYGVQLRDPYVSIKLGDKHDDYRWCSYDETQRLFAQIEPSKRAVMDLQENITRGKPLMRERVLA